MHATFTSGIARRREVDALPAGHGPLIIDYGNGHGIRGSSDEERAAIDAVNAKHDALGRINPIVDLFRDDGYPGSRDLHDVTTEYLFQLARIWSEWHSARIGTFPLEYRDYAGPADREYAEESGEDRVYWEITDQLSELNVRLRLSGVRTIDAADRIQDVVVHATAVLHRIYQATKEEA